MENWKWENDAKDSKDPLTVHWGLFDAVHRGFGLNERNGTLIIAPEACSAN